MAQLFGRLDEIDQADDVEPLGEEEVADELLSIVRQVEDAHALVSPAWELGEYGMEREVGADEPRLWFEGMMGVWEGGSPVDLKDQLEALRVLVVGLASTRQVWAARSMVEECAMALGAPSLDAIRRAYPEAAARYGLAECTGTMKGTERIFGNLARHETLALGGHWTDEDVADKLLAIARQVDDASASMEDAWERDEYGDQMLDDAETDVKAWFEGLMGSYESGQQDGEWTMESARALAVGLAATRHGAAARDIVEELAEAFGAPSLDAVRVAFPEVAARYDAGGQAKAGGLAEEGPAEPRELPVGVRVTPHQSGTGSWYAVWTDACQDLCDDAMPCLEAAVDLRARVGGTLLDAPMSYDGPEGSGPGFAMLVMDDASFDAEYAHDESVDCVLDEWLAPDGRVTPELREAANALYEMELEGMRRRRGATATPSAAEVKSRAAARAAQASGDGLGRDASQGGVGR